jgi:hypothetical protein
MAINPQSILAQRLKIARGTNNRLLPKNLLAVQGCTFYVAAHVSYKIILAMGRPIGAGLKARKIGCGGT